MEFDTLKLLNRANFSLDTTGLSEICAEKKKSEEMEHGSSYRHVAATSKISSVEIPEQGLIMIRSCDVER